MDTQNYRKTIHGMLQIAIKNLLDQMKETIEQLMWVHADSKYTV